MIKLGIGMILALTTNFALAEVKPHRYVLTQGCAQARETNPMLGGYSIVKACTASVVGVAGKYIVVTESAVRRAGAETQTTVWKVTREKAGRTGVLQYVTQVGFVDNKGLLKAEVSTPATGTVAKSILAGRESLSGELMGRKFTSGPLETVYHTQSL